MNLWYLQIYIAMTCPLSSSREPKLTLWCTCGECHHRNISQSDYLLLLPNWGNFHNKVAIYFFSKQAVQCCCGNTVHSYASWLAVLLFLPSNLSYIQKLIDIKNGCKKMWCWFSRIIIYFMKYMIYLLYIYFFLQKGLL